MRFWRISKRNGYDIVDWDEVWKTATRDVPDLLTKLKPFLPKRWRRKQTSKNSIFWEVIVFVAQCVWLL
jgi:hypothetical protein